MEKRSNEGFSASVIKCGFDFAAILTHVLEVPEQDRHWVAMLLIQHITMKDGMIKGFTEPLRISDPTNVQEVVTLVAKKYAKNPSEVIRPRPSSITDSQIQEVMGLLTQAEIKRLKIGS